MRNDFAINLNANITTGDPSASINQLTLTCNNVASIGNASGGLIYAGAGLNKNTITDAGTADSTITLTQNVGIFALSPLQSISEYTGLGGTNITHYAGLVINGVKATAGSALRIVNNYQLLINSSQQFSGSTTVSGQRWGIYQDGANDYNYFASKVLIGTTTSNSSILNVNGDTTLTGDVTVSAAGILKIRNIKVYSNNLYIVNSSNTDTIMTIFDNGNISIGTSVSATSRLLTVQGQQEWITATATGVHTTSGNHLPIWVNGVQYWLALLNPPVAP
jgi:hypothetical protein